MKSLLALLAALVLATVAQAGLLGWFSSRTLDWKFIQQSGGIRIAEPVIEDGKKVLPVEYWPDGNSALAIRRVELKQQGQHLMIRVVAQLIEKGSDNHRLHLLDLSSISTGSYEVYYQAASDPAQLLGKIVVP